MDLKDWSWIHLKISAFLYFLVLLIKKKIYGCNEKIKIASHLYSLEHYCQYFWLVKKFIITMSPFVFIKKSLFSSLVTTIVRSLPLTVKCCQTGVPPFTHLVFFQWKFFNILVNGKKYWLYWGDQHNNEQI